MQNLNKDLFVLGTPLQLLNAIEARHHFGDRPSSLALLHWGWPASAFDSLLGEMEWQEIVWVPMAAQRPAWRYPMLGPDASSHLNEYVWTYQQYRRRRRLEAALARFGRVDRLVVGNLLGDHMRHAIGCIPHAELMAVDDGTDTLRVAALRRNPSKVPEEPPPAGLIKSVKQSIRQRCEWDCVQPEAVTFFTACDIEIGPSDRLIRNDYRWLRGRAAGGGRTNQVYFLGQPLIEDGYVKESTYLHYLQRAIRYFGGKPVVYIPHKRESTRTVALIERELGLATVHFGGPIEVVLALGGELPDMLASFFCSALENCSILFGNSLEVVAFHLPPHVLICGPEPVEGIYEYFRRRQTETFQVLEV